MQMTVQMCVKQLKFFDSVGALDIDEANAAFDMDFDEVKVNNNNVSTFQKLHQFLIKKNNENDNDNDNALSDDEKKKIKTWHQKKKKQVGSDSIVKSNTIGDTLIQMI